MKKKLVAGLATGLILVGMSGIASAVDMTFMGLQSYETVLNYYNGGYGGNGSGPGPNYGVVFGADSLAGVSLAAGGGTNNFNQPSGSTTALFFLTGPGDIMNVAAGFTGGFSFYESGPYGGSVTVYDDLNATGNLLASLTLPSTPQGDTAGGSVNGYYSVWVPVGVSFSGLAKSVNFSGTANYIAFDDVTMGSSNPGPNGEVPEPATMLLLGTGLAGLAVVRRKKAA